jgi:hypothetical protein
MAVGQVQVDPGVGLYRSDLQEKVLPPPQWGTLVSLLDSRQNKVSHDELDPKIVHWLQKRCRGWDLPHLIDEVNKYPRPCGGEGMEREVQTESFPEVEFESPPVSPISISPQDVFTCQVGQKVPPSLAIGAEITLMVDLDFTNKDFKAPIVLPNIEEMTFGSPPHDEERRGIPSSPFLVSPKDLSLLSESLLQHLPIPEKESSSPFHKDTENLHGDLKEDLAKFDGETQGVD